MITFGLVMPGIAGVVVDILKLARRLEAAGFPATSGRHRRSDRRGYR
jgi:hypothetical protein